MLICKNQGLKITFKKKISKAFLWFLYVRLQVSLSLMSMYIVNGLYFVADRPKIYKGGNLLLSYLTHPNSVNIDFSIVKLVYK